MILCTFDATSLLLHCGITLVHMYARQMFSTILGPVADGKIFDQLLQNYDNNVTDKICYNVYVKPGIVVHRRYR